MGKGSGGCLQRTGLALTDLDLFVHEEHTDSFVLPLDNEELLLTKPVMVKLKKITSPAAQANFLINVAKNEGVKMTWLGKKRLVKAWQQRRFDLLKPAPKIPLLPLEEVMSSWQPPAPPKFYELESYPSDDMVILKSTFIHDGWKPIRSKTKTIVIDAVDEDTSAMFATGLQLKETATSFAQHALAAWNRRSLVKALNQQGHFQSSPARKALRGMSSPIYARVHYSLLGRKEIEIRVSNTSHREKTFRGKLCAYRWYRNKEEAEEYCAQLFEKAKELSEKTNHKHTAFIDEHDGGWGACLVERQRKPMTVSVRQEDVLQSTRVPFDTPEIDLLSVAMEFDQLARTINQERIDKRLQSSIEYEMKKEEETQARLEAKEDAELMRELLEENPL